MNEINEKNVRKYYLAQKDGKFNMLDYVNVSDYYDIPRIVIHYINKHYADVKEAFKEVYEDVFGKE